MVRVIDLRQANLIWLEALTKIHGVHHTWRAGDQGAGEMGIRGYPVIGVNTEDLLKQRGMQGFDSRTGQGESLSLGHSFGCRLTVN